MFISPFGAAQSLPRALLKPLSRLAKTTMTTHAEYNANTEALDVAKAFPEAIRGKAIVVTGVNLKGIGFSTAQAFASQSPAHLVVAGRNSTKLEECINELKQQWPDVGYRPLVLDLASQTAVRGAAKEVLSWSDVPAINILVNSAGISQIPERTITEDGIELQFATNHIGHFLFTNLIMPKLIKAAKASPKGATRVVNVSSGAAQMGGIRWSDINFEKKSIDLPEEERPNYRVLEAWGVHNGPDLAYIPLIGYQQGKAANVLFSVELTKKLYESHGILSLSLHPGVIMTELGRHNTKEKHDQVMAMAQRGDFTWRTQGAGASTTLVAATDPNLSPSVTEGWFEFWVPFLKDCQISNDAHRRAKSSEEAEKLWKLSEELVKEKFSW